MRLCISSATVLALLGLSVARPASAQQPPPATEVGASQLAIVNLPARTAGKLTVTSPAFAMLGDIPFENTSYRGNVFPGLAWTRGPAATRSYAVIMQDGDALARGAPILHWTMVNIPATVTQLDAGTIAFFCSYEGYNSGAGAEGVGRSTATAVVITSVAILVLDAVTALLLAPYLQA